MPEVILYHVPPSFYSQIARLALAEKGVARKSIHIAAGPPTFESYELGEFRQSIFSRRKVPKLRR